MKKIAILRADLVNSKLSPQFGEYADMITRSLRTGIRDFEYVVYDVQNFEYPKNINEVDAYFITGSSASVYDDLEWVRRLCEFTRYLDQHKKKIIGLCFGHQVVAHALGGQVARSSKGWNIGLSPVTLTAEGKKHNPYKDSFNLLNSHRDQVLKAAPGCKVLAGNDICPIYICQKEAHIFTIQGHIEMTPEYAASLYRLRQDKFEPTVYQEAMKSLDGINDYELVTKWIIKFIWQQ